MGKARGILRHGRIKWDRTWHGLIGDIVGHSESIGKELGKDIGESVRTIKRKKTPRFVSCLPIFLGVLFHSLCRAAHYPSLA